MCIAASALLHLFRLCLYVSFYRYSQKITSVSIRSVEKYKGTLRNSHSSLKKNGRTGYDYFSKKASNDMISSIYIEKNRENTPMFSRLVYAVNEGSKNKRLWF